VVRIVAKVARTPYSKRVIRIKSSKNKRRLDMLKSYSINSRKKYILISKTIVVASVH
jgi:hypothetical protein